VVVGGGVSAVEGSGYLECGGRPLPAGPAPLSIPPRGRFLPLVRTSKLVHMRLTAAYVCYSLVRKPDLISVPKPLF
jgi:hypothetical protein